MPQLQYSATNQQILNEFVSKWVVHFRDPRSVLLSWVHHVENLAAKGQFLSLMQCTPMPPKELHGWDFERRVDWHIEHFLPRVNQWMINWLAVADRMPERILVTEFTSLKEHEEEFVQRILDFLGIARASYTHKPPEKSMTSHYRAGTCNEWRQSFTPAQIDRINRTIPQELVARFGWPAS